MPEQSFFNYSIPQRCCKKQEAQLDTIAHSIQNTYQWLLSWVEEPGEVAHDRLVVRGGEKLVLNVCTLHMLWLAMKSDGILFIWGFYLALTLHTSNLDFDFGAISFALLVLKKMEFSHTVFFYWNIRVEWDLESTSQGLFEYGFSLRFIIF